MAADLTRRLLGSYRRGAAEDPEVYVTSIAAVFCHYPEGIVRRATDPYSGIASQVAWLPNLAEVKAFCEGLMAPIYREQERDRRAAQTQRLLAPPERATPEERERAVEHWEREKARITGKVAMNSVEQKQAAEKRITELYGAYQRPWPLPIGAELGKKIDALAVEIANEKREETV